MCLKKTTKKNVCLLCFNINALGKNQHYFCDECLEKHMEFHRENGDLEETNITGTKTYPKTNNMIFDKSVEMTGLF